MFKLIIIFNNYTHIKVMSKMVMDQTSGRNYRIKIKVNMVLREREKGGRGYGGGVWGADYIPIATLSSPE